MIYMFNLNTTDNIQTNYLIYFGRLLSSSKPSYSLVSKMLFRFHITENTIRPSRCFSFTSKVWWQKLKASDRIETSSRERKWLPLLLQNGHVVETSCLHSRKLQGNSIWQVSPLPYNQINSLSGDEVRFHSRSSDVEHSVQSLQEYWDISHWNASDSYKIIYRSYTGNKNPTLVVNKSATSVVNLSVTLLRKLG
jgi:hypothetical protein